MWLEIMDDFFIFIYLYIEYSIFNLYIYIFLELLLFICFLGILN